MSRSVILVPSARGYYGPLSSLAMMPFEHGGETYPSAEHFIQMNRYTDPVIRERVRVARTASEAVRVTGLKSVQVFQRPDWETIREEVVNKAVELKFQAYPELLKLLLSTGDAKLELGGSGDKYSAAALMALRDSEYARRRGEGISRADELSDITKRANWLIPEKVIVGALPSSEHMARRLVDLGVTHFVSLINIKYDVPENATQIKLVIPEGGVVGYEKIAQLITLLREIMNSGRNIIYLHCMGGHGRAGMIGAILVGLVYGLDTAEAVAYVEKMRETRGDTSRNFIPTPETARQINMIHAFLGLKEGNSLPDRSDTSWKNDRRKGR